MKGMKRKMTSSVFDAVFAAAKPIGSNVYNFVPKYKPYEKIFEKKSKGSSTTVPRDEIKANYDAKTLKIYDEVMYTKTLKDIVAIITSAEVNYHFSRYDITHCEKIGSEGIAIVDLDNGSTHYIGLDQVNVITRYAEDTKVKKVNEETGEVEDVLINKNKPTQYDFYSG